MPEVGDIIKAGRIALGLEQADLARRVGTTATQVSRWENGRQEPTASSCVAIARALGMSADELLGLVPIGLDLSGTWHAAWDTTRDRMPVIDRHTLTAHMRGVDFSFSADGDYLWSGSLRYVDGSLTGAYLSSERDKMYRGALYFALAPDGEAAIGRWAGLWVDGLVGGGWGVLARDEQRAADLIDTMLMHGGPLTEWRERVRHG